MLNKLRKLREKKGFTLVELIVVIAIIAILTAVLVPLIGNWSAQARYTTLQDGAKTISNTVNIALSSSTLKGATSCKGLHGTKTGGTLTITMVGSDGKDIAAPTGVDKDIAEETKDSLEATLDNGSTFHVLISNNTVQGVIYSNNKDVDVSNIADKTNIKPATGDYTEAYAYKKTEGKSEQAVGVSGSYVPAPAAGD